MRAGIPGSPVPGAPSDPGAPATPSGRGWPRRDATGHAPPIRRRAAGGGTATPPTSPTPTTQLAVRADGRILPSTRSGPIVARRWAERRHLLPSSGVARSRNPRGERATSGRARQPRQRSGTSIRIPRRPGSPARTAQAKMVRSTIRRISSDVHRRRRRCRPSHLIEPSDLPDARTMSRAAASRRAAIAQGPGAGRAKRNRRRGLGSPDSPKAIADQRFSWSRRQREGRIARDARAKAVGHELNALLRRDRVDQGRSRMRPASPWPGRRAHPVPDGASRKPGARRGQGVGDRDRRLPVLRKRTPASRRTAPSGPSVSRKQVACGCPPAT